MFFVAFRNENRGPKAVLRQLFVFLSFLMASGVAAQDAQLKSLETWDAAGPWQAVGRLDFNGRGFCTGALISDRLVLTAAHCLYDTATGKRINHEKVQFLAGWREGRASAYRKVRRAVVHPSYAFDTNPASMRVRDDVALLELEQPIRNTQIEPFETGSRPRKGERVGVVSYARHRSEAPSLQEVCTVLARQRGVLITSCSVDFGSSGAPIFTFVEGKAQIVSVVSAKAEVKGQNVSLGTALSEPLTFLKAELKAGRGVFQEPGPDSTRLRVGERRNNTGAKFVRPGE